MAGFWVEVVDGWVGRRAWKKRETGGRFRTYA